jgi:hypothetical protein
MKHHLKRHIDEKRCKFLKTNGNTSGTINSKDYAMIENEVKSLKKQLADLKCTVSGEKKVASTSVSISTPASVSGDISSRISDVERRLSIQEKKPQINHNVLNVICVTGNDNYLDMLTEKIGNFEQAIDYIKECALSDLSGDCKLIEKIYLDDPLNGKTNIFFSDSGRSKVTYYNEKLEQVHDNRTAFGKKLANSLQNSYLKGINYLIHRNLDNHISPNKFLEDYDLMTWNTHIYNLSDNTYQRKIVSQLSIPIRV